MRDTFRLRNAPVYGTVLTLLFTLGIVFLPTEPIGRLFTADETAARLAGTAAVRLVGTAFLLYLMLNVGFKGWRLSKKLLFVLPLFAVAVNNLPVIALLSGAAKVERAALVPLLAFECLSVALFEEIAFRGLVLPFALFGFRGRKHRTLLAVVLSSCLFGLLHLVNLPSAGPAALLQVGYSALIGAACAVMTVYAGNLPAAVLFHAVYNFCGYLVPELGAGALWDVPTIVITAVIGVAAAIYAVLLLKRADPAVVAYMLRETDISEAGGGTSGENPPETVLADGARGTADGEKPAPPQEK